MRGTVLARRFGLAAILMTAMACASDLPELLSQAEQAIADQQFCTAIHLLEKALPQAAGDERLLSLLRSAYRGEIPNRVAADDRATAQRYIERLRLIETKPTDSIATARAAGRQSPADDVKVVVPEGSGLPAGGLASSDWRGVASGSGGDHGSADRTGPRDLSTSKAVPTARAVSAKPIARRSPAGSGVADRRLPDDAASLAKAQRLVSQADALFVAKRYVEAVELYEQADQTAPESLAVARDRWVYCRLARTVDEINTAATNPTRWVEIRTELQSILEKVPGNSFAQSLLAMADRQQPNIAAAGPRDTVVRASEPEQRDGKQLNLLAGLATRIGLGASDSRTRSARKGSRSGAWHVLETSNFRVHATDEKLAGQVADIAESTRFELYRTWYGKLPELNWNPKCEIFVHDSADQYARITRQGPASPGHSQTGVERNRVTSRRIDLQRHGHDLVNAILPHEITHIVLADRFTSRPMPRWADEGMAVLTEPADKKHLHLKNLGDFLNRGRVFTARQLMTMEDYPNGSQWPMFYAESVSLVEFLVDRSGPVKFIDFMEGSLKNGYERELKRVYNLSGFDELDRVWSRGRTDQIARASQNVASR